LNCRCRSGRSFFLELGAALEMAVVSDFNLNDIVLTGGLACAQPVQSLLKDRCVALEPVDVYAGSVQCQARAT